MDARQQLHELVGRCARCRADYQCNVSLLAGDTLTDAQVVAVLSHLRNRHEGHGDDDVR